MSRQDQVSNRVYRLCRYNPALAEISQRNALLFEYWATYENGAILYEQGIYYTDKRRVKELTSSESITRALRNLIETGKITPTEASQQRSDELEQEYREHYTQRGG